MQHTSPSTSATKASKLFLRSKQKKMKATPELNHDDSAPMQSGTIEKKKRMLLF